MKRFSKNISASLKSIDTIEIQSAIDYWLLLFSIVIWRFPIAMGARGDLILRSVLVIPYIVQIIYKAIYLIRNKVAAHLDKKFLKIFILFSGTWILGFIRTIFYRYSFDTFYLAEYLVTLIILGLFLFLVLAYNNDIEIRQKLLKGIFYAFGLYMIINLLIFLSGGQSVELPYLAKYPAQILSILGISIYRTLFPMADGINSFGILSGAILVSLIPLCFSKMNLSKKIFSWLAVISCMIIILLTDSRGAIIYSILTLIIIIVPSKILKLLRWSPFLMSFFPIIILIIAPSLLKQNINIFKRAESQWEENKPLTNSANECDNYLQQSGGFLSNRPIIWEMVINELSDFQYIHIIGYGVRGQVVSSISNSYSCLFTSYARPTLASAHNGWLQTILDVGYIGFGIMLVLLVMIIVKLSNLFFITRDATYKAMLVSVIYIILSGTLEASFSPDSYGTFIILMFVSIGLLFAHPANDVSHPLLSNY
jgi:hypothetical protein